MRRRKARRIRMHADATLTVEGSRAIGAQRRESDSHWATARWESSESRLASHRILNAVDPFSDEGDDFSDTVYGNQGDRDRRIERDRQHEGDGDGRQNP